MMLLKKLCVTKANTIDTSGFPLKTRPNTDISSLEKKLDDTDISGVVIKQILMLESLRFDIKYQVLLA